MRGEAAGTGVGKAGFVSYLCRVLCTPYCAVQITSHSPERKELQKSDITDETTGYLQIARSTN